jgi:hypothetical protein
MGLVYPIAQSDFEYSSSKSMIGRRSTSDLEADPLEKACCIKLDQFVAVLLNVQSESKVDRSIVLMAKCVDRGGRGWHSPPLSFMSFLPP